MLLVSRTTHPFIAGALLAAVLAAIMSTADSQLLVTSSALTEDFYRMLLRRNAGERELVWFGRFGVIAVAAVASVIAFSPENTVLTLVAYAWAGFGATFGPVILLSLYWKRMTRFGAIAGIVSGGCTVLVWKHLSSDIHPIFGLYEIVPGFILSVCAIIIVSLVTSPPSAEIQAEFDLI
jgi:sodium/proline symporter